MRGPQPKLKIEKFGENQWQWKVFRKETQAVSEGYSRKFDAERGFEDCLDSMLLIAWKRGGLIDALERTGLTPKLGNALG